MHCILFLTFMDVSTIVMSTILSTSYMSYLGKMMFIGHVWMHVCEGLKRSIGLNNSKYLIS